MALDVETAVLVVDERDKDLVRQITALVVKYWDAKQGDISNRAMGLVGCVAALLGHYFAEKPDNMEAAVRFMKAQAVDFLRTAKGPLS